MSIDAITQPTQQFLVQANAQGRYFLSNISRIAHNISKAALPMIAFYAISSIPEATGGPILYAGCIAGCIAMRNPPGCWEACLIAFRIPGGV